MKEHASLTARQRAVLALVATGATNAEIAAALGLSADTVRHHRSLAYARLGIHDRPARVQAAVWHAEQVRAAFAGRCMVFQDHETALAALGALAVLGGER